MERNRVSPRRDEAAKPSRWWRSRWNGALPASQARNRFLGWRLWQWSPAQRPAACTDFSPTKVQPGSQVISHGWPGYQGLEPQGFPHTATPLPGDPEAAHRLFPWLYIARSHRKRFLLGTPHKVESQHLQRYLAEFNYRLNRRTMETNRFHRLVRACLTTNTVIYKELIAVPDQA